MAYGTKTSNIMDVPLSVKSVVAPYLSNNNYTFEGSNSIRVLSVANGSLGNYDETSATAPFGSPSLISPSEQVLTLAYNKSMIFRIQRTQLQDIPVSDFTKQVALQQIDQVFIPAHDIYSLAKIFAARPTGNVVARNTSRNDFGLKTAVDKVRTKGGDVSNIIAWVTYTFASEISDKINYTGSDAGYTQGRNGYLGKNAGVDTVEVPDSYFFAGVHSIIVDKRAIINVKPKMDPSNDMVVLEKVPLFSGVECQIRDRADTFVLTKKVDNIATIETAASTTTTTAA